MIWKLPWIQLSSGTVSPLARPPSVSAITVSHNSVTDTRHSMYCSHGTVTEFCAVCDELESGKVKARVP